MSVLFIEIDNSYQRSFMSIYSPVLASIQINTCLYVSYKLDISTDIRGMLTKRKDFFLEVIDIPKKLCFYIV